MLPIHLYQEYQTNNAVARCLFIVILTERVCAADIVSFVCVHVNSSFLYFWYNKPTQTTRQYSMASVFEAFTFVKIHKIFAS